MLANARNPLRQTLTRRASRWHARASKAFALALPLLFGGTCSASAQIDNYGLFTGLNTVSPGRVVEFDTLTNAAIGAPITTASWPSAAVFSQDGRLAYTVNADDTVTVIDVVSRTVVATIPVAHNSEGLALSPDGGSLYVTNGDNGTVTVISTATNSAVGAPITVGSGPFNVAVSPDGSKLYITNVGSNTVSVVDAVTHAVNATIPVGSSPLGITVSPDGSRIYVANEGGTPSVSVINAATQTVTATIPIVGGSPAPMSVAVSPDGTHLYVTTQDATLFVINTATNTVSAKIPLPDLSSGVLDGSVGVALTPDGKKVYVTTSDGGYIIDPATNTIVGRFEGPVIGALGNGTTGTGFIGPNVLVASGGSLSVANDAALTSLGFGQYVDFNGGTLRFTGAFNSARTISLLAGGGAIDTNGFNATLSGQIINTGSLTKTGAGTLTLTGNNSYTGGTFLTGGTLSVSSDNNLGDATGALTFNGGILQITGTAFNSTARTINWDAAGGGFDIADAGNIFTVTQALSGTGGLTKSGLGTLLLSGNNSYAGATTIAAGILQAGSTAGLSSASAFTVAGGAALDLNGFNSSIGSLAGGGEVKLGAATLTSGGDSSSTTFSGVVSGSGGLTKTGTGTLVLSGTNTYTGATTVNGGTLQVDGILTGTASVDVNSGGILSGTGNIDPLTVSINSGGTFAPGIGAPGSSITVTGNLALASGAAYSVQLDPGAASFANVTGTATLGGATVQANFASAAPGAYVEKRYTILKAAGGVNGTFSGPVDTNLPTNFQTALNYDGNNAYLGLTLNFVPPTAPSFGGGLNGNQQRIANTLVNFFNARNGIPMAFGALTPSGLTQVSGETATGSQQAAFDATNLFMAMMLDPAMSGRGEVLTPSSPALGYAASGTSRTTTERDAYAMVTKAPPAVQPVFAQGWSVWASGFGGSQTTNGNSVAGSNNTTSSIFGGAAGADYHLALDTLLGFALAGGGTSFRVDNGGSGHSDLFQAGVFARHDIGAAYVSSAVAYGWQALTTDRVIGADHLRAKFDANSYSGRIESGYRFVTPVLGGLGITPYAAGQVSVFDLPGYAEQAIAGLNTFASSYASKSVTDARSELGLRTDKSFMLDDALLTLRGRAAWAHDFNTDRAVGATFQTLPGASFVVNGAAQAADNALVSASAETTWRNGWSVAAAFEGEFSDTTTSLAGKGTVRYAW